MASLTWWLDPLHNLFSIYPGTATTFRACIHSADLGRGIRAAEFQFKKERILILHYILERSKGLTRSQIRPLAEGVLNSRDKQTILTLLKNLDKSITGFLFSWVPGLPKLSTPRVSKEEETWRAASSYASQFSDSRFLSEFKPNAVSDCLVNAVVEAEEIAYASLAKQIEPLVSRIHQQIFSTQNEECSKQAQREVKSDEDKELAILRSGFVRQIEESSRKHSGSYVPHTFGLRPITQHNVGERLFMSTASKRRRRATTSRVRYLTLSYQEYVSFPPPDSYFVSGRRESLQNQEIEYQVHHLSLLADQRHNLQLDSSYVPTPVLNERFSQSFRIPSEIIVR